MVPSRTAQAQPRPGRPRKTAARTPAKTGSRAKTSPRAPARILARTRVPAAVVTLAAPSGTARFAAGKALVATARKDPARVYPHFDALAPLLASDSKIVRWNTLQIIAALAPADTARRLDALLDTYLAFIAGHNLISAANAIQGAGQIAQARPDLLDRIIPAILAVAHATYETPACRNVAIGHALDTFAELDALAETGPRAGLRFRVCRRPDVAAFIRRQQTNTRAAVARSAQRMTTELASAR